MKMTLSPDQAQFLYGQIGRIATAAQELGKFGETEPDLAGACGVEVCSLEARTILAGGYLQRLAAAAAESVRSGRPATVAAEDLEAASRLEGAVALGSSRIGNKMAALEAESSQEGVAKIGGLLGMATGAVGLIKSIF